MAAEQAEGPARGGSPAPPVPAMDAIPIARRTFRDARRAGIGVLHGVGEAMPGAVPRRGREVPPAVRLPEVPGR